MMMDEEKSLSSNMSSSQDDTTTTNQNEEKTEQSEELAKNETRQVNRSKLLVYLALLLAAAGVGTAAYFFVYNQEKAEFEREFRTFADEIVDMSNTNAENIFGQVNNLATTITSYSSSSNRTWPNVTLPHFDLRAREAEDLSGIELIIFMPVVTESEKLGWEDYAWKHQTWIDEDLKYQRYNVSHPGNITRNVYPYTGDGSIDTPNSGRTLTTYDENFYTPIWQLGPLPSNASIINLDVFTHPTFHRMIDDVLEIEHKLLSEVIDVRFLLDFTSVQNVDYNSPRNFVLAPVFDTFQSTKRVVAFLVAEMKWETFFVGLLPKGTAPIVVDVKDTCGSEFTYMVEGPNAKIIGEGDLHDLAYDYLGVYSEFGESARYDGAEANDDGSHCYYTTAVYPTRALEDTYHSNEPIIYSLVVVTVFVFTAMTFAFYDWMVARRQKKVLNTATRTKAIVSSLFPKNVQERIMAEAEKQAEMEARGKGGKTFGFGAKSQLKEFLGDGPEEEFGTDGFKTTPIADLFTECTVMFADIVGFTAWSSMREPSQVFTLLESIFHEFDQIAHRRRVFKVETVGDCYVAVAGLPDPRKDHATTMARFARDCLYKFSVLLKRLEESLGPDTTELGMRFGLHSGPVTAGVLRGEKARFQLFGDTMNTTARIESTGAKNKIHLSQETADLLISSGKSHWVRPREDKVVAKGKGELTTFWLELKGDRALSSRSGSSESGSDFDDLNDQISQKRASKTPTGGLPDKYVRLVNWNKELMLKVLKEQVARRTALNINPDSDEALSDLESKTLQHDHTVLDEVKDVVRLPEYRSEFTSPKGLTEKVRFSDNVVDQLFSFLHAVASMYRDNPFHNFEHASHVTMSVVKLLGRIVTPEEVIAGSDGEDEDTIARNMHEHTYGITSSPLTQFAVIFSALIHDVDHTGVPNSILVQEQSSIAAVYKNKSVAEQNSVDIAWELLMQDCFKDLRRTIYTTADEFSRFRQMVVNMVMATDIMDKELSAARKARWNVAFSESVLEDESPQSETASELMNRRATIVIEHVMQASDVAHTMQHWHIYRKWNQRLFEEMYRAYQDGRSDKDPSLNWYEGEIGFFDFYIIPLAMKLRSCGVFGVSSDEYLNYAKQNRKEWEARGREVVEEMVASVKSKQQFKEDEVVKQPLPAMKTSLQSKKTPSAA